MPYVQCHMSNDRYLKTLLLGKMDGRKERGHPHREWTDECCGVVRGKSAGTEPLSTGLKQLAEDGEAGVGRQRALSQ